MNCSKHDLSSNKKITEKYKIMAEKTQFFILTGSKTFHSDW